MNKNEALRMAIEHLKEAENIIEGKCEKGGYFQKPIQACQEALEQPADGIELEWYCKGWDDAEKDLTTQEPAAYIMKNDSGRQITITKEELDNLTTGWTYIRDSWKNATPLYTTPPSREWVKLSDWDCVEIYGHANLVDWRVVRAIEAKLKEKNT